MGRVDTLADELMEVYGLSEDQAYAVADYVISDEKVHFSPRVSWVFDALRLH